jgi:uracil-DNA glycosylase family protein
VSAQRLSTAEAFLPARLSLSTLGAAVDRCRGCPLWRDATQGVTGEGRKGAILLVGEQPGDQEDRVGRPFVGAAGRLLDDCLTAAGLERRSLYLTNAVKHFKHEVRGKRRIHERPSLTEVDACFPWLRAEVELVKPPLIVCLGATAARAAIGPGLRIAADHGREMASRFDLPAIATYHPSAILRAREERRRELHELLVADLRFVARRRRELAAGAA